MVNKVKDNCLIFFTSLSGISVPALASHTHTHTLDFHIVPHLTHPSALSPRLGDVSIWALQEGLVWFVVRFNL